MISDEQLVVSYLAGDEAAFTELTNRYREKLTETIAHRLKDWGRAEDIVQQAFIKVFKYIHKFDATLSSFEEWMFWKCMNCFTDECRKNKRKKLVTGQLPDRPIHQPPDSRLNQEDIRVKFWAFLDTLSAERKQAICLIFVEGLSYSVAAKKSGVLAVTLKKRVAVVMPALTAAVGEEYPGLFELERRHTPRVGRPNPFYSVPRTADTFTIRELVEALPENEFLATDLVCYAGVGVGEASDVLGLPVDTIEAHLDGSIDFLRRRVFGLGWLAKAA